MWPLLAQKNHKLCSSKTPSPLHRHPFRESVQRSSDPSCRRSRAARSSHFQTIIVHIRNSLVKGLSFKVQCKENGGMLQGSEAWGEVWGGRGREGFVCGGKKFLRLSRVEVEPVRSRSCTYPVFHRRKRISISRGHALCFRRGAVGSLRTKVPAALKSPRPHAPKFKKDFCGSMMCRKRTRADVSLE